MANTTQQAERLSFAAVRAALPRPYPNCDRRRYVVWALYELERKAHHGDVPFQAGYIAQGIAWTMSPWLRCA